MAEYARALRRQDVYQICVRVVANMKRVEVILLKRRTCAGYQRIRLSIRSALRAKRVRPKPGMRHARAVRRPEHFRRHSRAVPCSDFALQNIGDQIHAVPAFFAKIREDAQAQSTHA